MTASFGCYLKELMDKKKIKSQELARRMRRSPGTISSWCRGRATPTPELCRFLAVALDTPYEEIAEQVVTYRYIDECIKYRIKP